MTLFAARATNRGRFSTLIPERRAIYRVALAEVGLEHNVISLEVDPDHDRNRTEVVTHVVH
jgi:hypothetical protein